MRYGGLIAAIVFAAIAAVVVLKMSAKPAAEPTPVAQAPTDVKTVNIYVALKPIPVGTLITKDMVGSQPWPEHLALPSFVPVKEGSTVEGMVARGPFQQSEPIISSKIANPNDPSFLAGDLPKGMRVITIPINEVDGVAGFIFPGDHVDVLYTHEVEEPVSAQTDSAPALTVAKQRTLTETLLTNVKVLAIDQHASNAGATDKNGNLVVPRSASLMVSQSDAQRIRLAHKTGALSLALRSIEDKESSDPLLVTGPGDVSQWKGEDSSPDGRIKVVRGAPATPSENLSSGTLARGAPSASGLAPSIPLSPPPVMP